MIQLSTLDTERLQTFDFYTRLSMTSSNTQSSLKEAGCMYETQGGIIKRAYPTVLEN